MTIVVYSRTSPVTDLAQPKGKTLSGLQTFGFGCPYSPSIVYQVWGNGIIIS